MDLRRLQAFLGHANLNTVAVYTQVGIKALKDLHQAMHPVAGLRGQPGSGAAGGPEVETTEALMAALEAESQEETKG